MVNGAIKFSTNTKITYGNSSYKVTEGNVISTETGRIGDFLANNDNLKNITNVLKTFIPKDGNNEDLTYEDLAYATNLKNQYGIKDVKRDANAGIVTFVCDDGVNLRFDFETREEKEKRLQLENNIKNAEDNGYGDSYKLDFSEDLQKYEITVKRFFTAQPTIRQLAKDFGVDPKELIRLNKHLVEQFNPNDDARSIVDTQVKGDTTFYIPVDMVKFNEDGPTGFWGRNFGISESNPHAAQKIWSKKEYLDFYLNQ